MKIYSILFFAVLFGTQIHAQDPSNVLFKSSECGFSALLPNEPSVKKDSVFAQGQYIFTTEYLLTSESKVIYSITCGDFPVAKMLDSKQKILTTLRAGTAPKVGGEIQNLEEIDLNGNHGYSYIEKSDMFTVYNQILLAGDNLFQIHVSSLIKDAKAEADEFYKNFKLN